jgi:hypothetical protein
MAGSRTTHAKRQKERSRQEKRVEKAQKKAQRKMEQELPPGEGAEPVVRTGSPTITYDEDGLPLPLSFDDF